MGIPCRRLSEDRSGFTSNFGRTRKEGRFRCGRAHPGLTFYASEEDGIRDVEAALTAKYAWCAGLGVRFPCSVDTIKAAYRRLVVRH